MSCRHVSVTHDVSANQKGLRISTADIRVGIIYLLADFWLLYIKKI